ncbi:MAG: hypothetical protein ACNY01_09850, partial [Desulfobacteria bacterium]
FEIGQGWPEAVMHSCGSYCVPVPTHRDRGSRLEGFFGVGEVVVRERLYAARQIDSGKENSCLREPH